MNKNSYIKKEMHTRDKNSLNQYWSIIMSPSKMTLSHTQHLCGKHINNRNIYIFFFFAYLIPQLSSIGSSCAARRTFDLFNNTTPVMHG